MKTIITYSLTPEQQESWLNFWQSTKHAHPRQHYAMGQVEIAKGRKPIYAMGLVGSELVAIGIFSVRLLWNDKKFSMEAICYSGPVIENPKHMRPFMEEMIDYFKEIYVGNITITPYWLYPEAAAIKDELAILGFSPGS